MMLRIRPLILGCLLLPTTLIRPVVAQEKAGFDPSKAEVAPLGLPSPYDKFLGLDQVLNLDFGDWKKVYGEIATDVVADKFTNETDVSLALGVKIADGVMAIKARNVQGLNDCSKQIEDLAKKLGVKDDEMSRAKIVRAHANKGEWLQVFMELGFLQTDIMKSLRAQGNTKRRSLIITAGWMQGLQYTAYVVKTHYSANASNYLREPVLVKAMQADLATLAPDIKSSPKVVALMEALPGIFDGVNIAVEGSISKEGVDKLYGSAKGIVEKITGD
ncbi:MAG: hypothetical protein ACAI34_21460 [Verrucomicrobium sp.]|nr:hypothetical protein [Verrucomicrobium sp.]